MATPSAPAPPPQDSDLNPDHHHEPPSSSSSPSLSPPTPILTLSNPDSPKPLQSISPPAKKTPPLPWSHQETVNLIQAYQEKWYSLKRGQLKSSQWEEVAITVAARCGYDDPSKTSTQCRHKIEKLRKRYRAEKQRPNPRAWEFFDLMDSLERGPLPISARPMAPIQYHNSNPIHAVEEDNGNADDDDDEEEANEAKYNDTSKRNKSKSINHLVRGQHMSMNKPAMDRKSSGGGDRVLQKQMLGNGKKRFERYESDGEEDDDDEEEEEEEGEGGREVVLELAAEIKAFAERFVRMENKKVEMMRETLRGRMEMENKRMEMILESQQKIVDTIGRAFGSHKKLKIAQDI